MLPILATAFAALFRALLRADLLVVPASPELVQAERLHGERYLLIDDGAMRLVRVAPGRAPELVSDAADLAAFAVDDDELIVLLALGPLGPHRLAKVSGCALVPIADVPFATHLSLEAEAIVYRDARGREHRLPKRR